MPISSTPELRLLIKMRKLMLERETLPSVIHAGSFKSHTCAHTHTHTHTEEVRELVVLNNN